MDKKQVMRDRVYGIENEFGVMFVSSDGKMHGGDYIARHGILESRIRKEGKKYGVMLGSETHRTSDVWLINGGMVCIDMSHPEFASPECRRIRDAVAHNKASEILIRNIFSFSKNSKKRIRFFKNNIGKRRKKDWQVNQQSPFRFHSYGCHENYLFFREDLFSNVKLLVLAPFLGTRQIYDGAGWWVNPAKNEFVLSQRALFLGKDVSSDSMRDGRAIINSRDQSHAGGSLKRLHLILGDANMLECALFLKLGTTSLVLSLFEADKLPHYILENPIETVRCLSMSRDFDKKILAVRRGSGACVECMSPLMLHSELCELAEKYIKTVRFESEESEHEAHIVVDLWNETITALARGDKEWQIGRIDYATKEYIAEEIIKRNSHNLSHRIIRAGVDVLYHELGPGTTYERLKLENRVTRIVSDEEISHAVKFPPNDTRAYARGMVVASDFRKKRKRIKFINWEEVNIDFVDDSYKSFALDDPLQSNPPWLKKFLDTQKENI